MKEEPPASLFTLDRRQVIQGLAAAGLYTALGGLGVGGLGVGCTRPAARRAAIREENARPGTTDWLLTRTRIDEESRWRSPSIEGYCSRTAVRAGDRLAVMVSTDPPSPFVLDLYRMGYYGGKGGRHLRRLGPFAGRVQREPAVGPERLRECLWEPAAEITIPADWPSGVYLGKLTAQANGFQSYVVFLVRDDRPCDVLVQCSTSTWAAYNRWPDEWSLYNDGVKPWYWGPGVRVSWSRPYGKYCQIVDTPLSLGSGEFLLWEHPFVYWLEGQGYDVSYTGSADTHADPEGLLRAKLWISVGHDEYWTLDMFHNVSRALAAGVNLAFLSGNVCYGVIDLHPDHAGVPHRALSRVGQFGPLEPRVADHDFPEVRTLPRNGPDESMLIGARTNYPLTGAADWICARERHWIFDGTGMRDGDRIPGLVGWEWHGKPAPIPGLEVVAAGHIHRRNASGTYTATVYPGPRANFVFNAATCWWSDGLASPPGYQHPSLGRVQPLGPDPRVQRITANLLRRAGALPA